MSAHHKPKKSKSINLPMWMAQDLKMLLTETSPPAEFPDLERARQAMIGKCNATIQWLNQVNQ